MKRVVPIPAQRSGMPPAREGATHASPLLSGVLAGVNVYG